MITQALEETLSLPHRSYNSRIGRRGTIIIPDELARTFLARNPGTVQLHFGFQLPGKKDNHIYLFDPHFMRNFIKDVRSLGGDRLLSDQRSHLGRFVAYIYPSPTTLDARLERDQMVKIPRHVMKKAEYHKSRVVIEPSTAYGSSGKFLQIRKLP